MATSGPRHVVAVVGGATAGAEAAAMLAQRGVLAVVFEQNARPYGKIEDGLPRWHVKLRRKEYETINDKLGRPGVYFVPCTKIGRDIDFPALASEWGFSAVLLAHGAWRDRPLAVRGADAYLGKGLVYQNPFIYWFNHYTERSYDGPQYEVADGAIVVGGGLASIDVLKVLQIETVRAALAERGIDEEMLKIEQEGVPAVLDEHGFRWQDLGLRGATLVYRRRIEDMPLAEMPDEADEARRQKVESTRRRILEKAMQKYLFSVMPLRLPADLLTEGDRLVGLRLQRTRLEDGQAVAVDGAFEEMHAPLVVSSIGSVPEPMEGVEQDGHLYRWRDADLGTLGGYDTVFSTGNVVTGKGNIVASRKHSVRVTTHVIEDYLGLGNGRHEREGALLERITGAPAGAPDALAATLRHRPPLSAAQVEALLARVEARRQAVGFTTEYRDWLERVTPPDPGLRRAVHGTVCVLTGGTSGIGRETAVALAGHGARLALVCRDEGRGAEVAAEIAARTGSREVAIHLADLSSQREIRRVAGELLAAYPAIHVLVNNAGVVNLRREVTVDGREAVFATNHLAYVLLTLLLLDRLRTSAPARIVNVASDAHRFGRLDFDDLENARRYRTMSVYGQSKLANILFTYELARRLHGSGVTVNCLHPGAVATRLGHNNGAVARLLTRALRPFFRTPADGAETSIWLASAPEVEGVSGEYFVRCRPKRSSAESRDETVARRLWEVSLRMTGLEGTAAGTV